MARDAGEVTVYILDLFTRVEAAGNAVHNFVGVGFGFRAAAPLEKLDEFTAREFIQFTCPFPVRVQRVEQLIECSGGESPNLVGPGLHVHLPRSLRYHPS